MSTELVPIAAGRIDPPHGPAGPHLPAVADGDVVAAFLAGRSPRTLKAYGRDLADFARFLGQPGASAAVALLLAGSSGPANACALAYRADMTGRGLATATIARRIAALRSVVKLARTLGRVEWTLTVEAPRVETLRDTRGPGLDGWRRMLQIARERATTPKGKRDLAIVRLLHDLGLRRGEALGLDLADVDLKSDPPTVAIVGKGKRAKTRLTLNAPTAAALAEWIATHPGPGPAAPLFVGLDPGADPSIRLDDSNVYRLVRDLGRRAGLARPARPHGLRHQGITRALDLAGGDVRKVQRFSRHAKLETLMRYDDARRDDAGAIARMLGEDS